MKKINIKYKHILTVLFWTSMILLTVFSKNIHYNMLPKVEVNRLTKESFEIDTLLGMYEENRWAVPKKLYNNGGVYIIDYEIKYGLERAYAKRLELEVGLDNGEFLEVLNYFEPNLNIIYKSSHEIQEGDEVFVIKN